MLGVGKRAVERTAGKILVGEQKGVGAGAADPAYGHPERVHPGERTGATAAAAAGIYYFEVIVSTTRYILYAKALEKLEKALKKCKFMREIT